MATEELDPSGDGSVTEWGTQSGSDHYAMIDDGVRQPTAPTVPGTYINSSSSQTDEITIEAGELVNITEATIWIYADQNNGDISGDISFDGGTSYTESPQEFDVTDPGWYSITFSELSETNSATIEVKFTNAGIITPNFIYEAYVIVTGDEAPAGQFMGMKKYW